MDNSDKLIDMVGENKEVMKSVEKRRNIPDKAEIVENAQTITVTNEKPGGIALYVTNNKEDETGMEKDTRYGEDSYKERHGIKEIIRGGIYMEANCVYIKFASLLPAGTKSNALLPGASQLQ